MLALLLPLSPAFGSVGAEGRRSHVPSGRSPLDAGAVRRVPAVGAGTCSNAGSSAWTGPRRPLISLPVQAGVGASAEAGGGVNLGGQPRPSWAHARQARATATLRVADTPGGQGEANAVGRSRKPCMTRPVSSRGGCDEAGGAPAVDGASIADPLPRRGF